MPTWAWVLLLIACFMTGAWIAYLLFVWYMNRSFRDSH